MQQRNQEGNKETTIQENKNESETNKRKQARKNKETKKQRN